MQLVTGSSGTASSGSSSSGGEQTDAGASAEGHVEKDTGYEAGIPGPITRLFIIANRGIANLVQDLILVSCTLLNISFEIFLHCEVIYLHGK